MRGAILIPLFAIALVSASWETQGVPSPKPETPSSAPTEILDPASVERDRLVADTRTVLDAHRTGLSGAEREELAIAIVDESAQRNLDPKLVLAVIATESAFDTFAVSRVGAMGLMQVMPRTGEELADRAQIPWRGSHTLFDPIVNVRLGIAYLHELSNRYGSLPTALAAYNWGPGHIDQRLRRGTPLPVEYARLVLAAYGVSEDEADRGSS